MKYRRILLPGAVILVLISAVLSCSGEKTPVNITKDGIAIKGYDPVAYFTMKESVKGNREFSYEWNGAMWLFSSREHLELFMSAPEKYSPKYGGYCAYAVSQGTTADIDPDAWTIVDRKLYLNLDKKVQGLWEKDIPGYIEKADRNWPKVLGR